MNKIVQLKFREINRDIFEAIQSGVKKIETRAATKKYAKLQTGDQVELICGKDKLIKEVIQVKIFKDVQAILQVYRPQDINPATKTEAESEKMWYGFPGYKEKIAKYGLIALELK